MRKTHEQYVDLLYQRNPNIEILENYNNGKDSIQCKCKQHNIIWQANKYNILHGSGCPKCNQSLGEKIISEWLVLHNIAFIPQKKFIDCIDIRLLPFDFYLPKLNKCIEYDGEQHFKSKDYFGGQESFEITQCHDKIKNEYCKINNIPLLRIPYYANVEEELEKFLA